MPEIDIFATTLLEEAKRFLERSGEQPDNTGKVANLHAALMLGFCALEAHTNAIADDFEARSDLSIHDKGVMLEKEVRLVDGAFVLTDNVKMVRLDDRIQFLHRHFSGKEVDRSLAWWSELRAAMKLRNELTHPKGAAVISEDAVRRALQAIIDTLSAMFQAVYKTKFPPASRGLQSKLDF